ncbi:MAG TPA: sugar phosphate nucleotidyltransferase [Terriglobales bacterium]|nr:sugar phosphate nucleotidyltransferase [Terriglobales bacterium]
MLGIVPAAGSATRLQPLGGSKELLPLGSRHGRLRVVAEYLLERMFLAGAERVCLIVSGEKSDLLRYFARLPEAERMFFVVQPRPTGLCDAVFRATPYVRPDEPVLIGLPDTVWHPADAFRAAFRESVHLITFPVERPEEFDAVIEAAPGQVRRVEVKKPGSSQRRVWGAITAPGHVFLRLHQFWRAHGQSQQYLGDLLNAWMAAGERVSCDHTGNQYWDIGTPTGYQRALTERAWQPPAMSSEAEAARPAA